MELTTSKTTDPDFGGFRFYVEHGSLFDSLTFSEAYHIELTPEEIDQIETEVSSLTPGEWLEVIPPERRGGSRPGAGRPPLPEADRKLSVSLSLDPATVKALDNRAEALRCSRSEALSRYLSCPECGDPITVYLGGRCIDCMSAGEKVEEAQANRMEWLDQYAPNWCIDSWDRLRATWEELETPILDVVDMTTEEITGHIRQWWGRYWLYCDDEGGYEMMTKEEVADLLYTNDLRPQK